MLKKILTYILSLTLITSQNIMVNASSETKGTFLPGKILSQIDDSFSETDFENLDDGNDDNIRESSKNISNENQRSGSELIAWMIGCGISGILALAIAVAVKKDPVQELIAKLEKQNIKISNADIICALTCSAIQGISYIEGKCRAVRANRDQLYDLVKTLVLLRSYHCIDVLFDLKIYYSEKAHPDLLKICLTSGDDMVGLMYHEKSRYIENQIKKANAYIDKIKNKFKNLSRREVFAKFDLYKENNTYNLNRKQGLLQSLLIISMNSEKLDNLIKNVVDANH